MVTALVVLGGLAVAMAATPVPRAAADRATGAIAAQLTAAAGGTIRALVIGIDNYAHVTPLNGAVADAQDLSSVLRRAGVVDLTVLIDDQASRAAVVAALTSLVDRAAPGNLVIVTFAGHGTQEPREISAAEPDGMDEFLLLPGFGWEGGADGERILDDEINGFMARLAAKGAATLLIADNCHGGGMSKAPDPRAGRLSVRAVAPPVDRGPASGGGVSARAKFNADMMGLIAPLDDGSKDIANFTFLAAVGDQELAPELAIAGAPTLRGALSYATARALEGHADANRDGTTTRLELLSFVRRHVRMLSGHRQSPVGGPIDARAVTAALWRSPVAAVSNAVIASPIELSDGYFSRKPLGGGTASPRIIQDVKSGDLIDATGAVLAYGRRPTAFQGANMRAAAFDRLNAMALARGLDVTIEPGDRILHDGDQFTARIEGLTGRHLVVANLAGDGEVQFLFPPGNADTFMDRAVLDLPLRAVAPFGTDTLVVVATAERRPSLELALRLINGKVRPLELVSALADNLQPDDLIGLATYSTAPR